MNNTPSLNEINKTANMDPNLITRHYRLKRIYLKNTSTLLIT